MIFRRKLLVLATALTASTRAVQGGTSKLQITIPKSLSKTDGYDHRDALFGIPPYGGSIQQQVYYTASTFCDLSDTSEQNGFPKGAWQSPFILMVDRGDCTFVQKVRNAQRAGAAGVLIADNTCLCTFQDDCTPDNPDEECEVNEPIMADDGSGSDITIPSFLMFKQDADPVKDYLKTNKYVRVTMSFSVPQPDDRVEYDLWTTPMDEVSQPIQKHFKEAAVALGERAYFTPHMYIYDGMRAGCDQDGVNECSTLCTNNGRYCALDPDDDLDAGISGADVVAESLRRICIWQEYGNDDGIGVEYWKYIDEFAFRCGDPDQPKFFTDAQCISDAMEHSEIDVSKIDGCISDSGGLDGDVTNTALEEQLKSKDSSGVVLIPTLFVNSAPIRGQLSFATAFKAICSGYAQGSEPVVCTQCANCNDEANCVKHGHCGAGYSDLLNAATYSEGSVSIQLFAGIVTGLVLFFCCCAYCQHVRAQRRMRQEVRGILAEYMPLDANKAMQDNSVGLEQDDETNGTDKSAFTIS